MNNIEELYETIGGDYASALLRFAQNQKIIERFLLRFPQDKTFYQLKDAYERHDDSRIYNSACTLMEVCESLALSSMAMLARGIVEAYRTGEAATRSTYNVPFLMESLTKQYDSVIESINEYTTR